MRGLGRFGTQFFIIRSFFRIVEQAQPRNGDLVEQFLRFLGMVAQSHILEIGHEAVGRRVDDVPILFEQLDAQQPIMIWGLIFWRDAEPFVVRIKVRSHEAPSFADLTLARQSTSLCVFKP